MDWTNRIVLKFLELYKSHRLLWDPQHSSHKNKIKLRQAWADIHAQMGSQFTIAELKKKKESLMSAYRAYKTRIRQSQLTAEDPLDVYQPQWFAYELMNSFLGNVYRSKVSVTNVVNEFQGNNDYQETESAINQDTTEINIKTLDEENSTDGVANQRSASPRRKIKLKRKLGLYPELQYAKNQMDEAFSIVKNMAQPIQEKDDESDIFGKLVAKKLRKLSEDRRDKLMIQINQLFYDERQDHTHNSNYSE